MNTTVVRLLNAYEDLIVRCDGPEGVRADGTNICTMGARGLHDEVAREYLAGHWGEKCAEYDCDCPCCVAWQLFEELGHVAYDEEVYKIVEREYD